MGSSRVSAAGNARSARLVGPVRSRLGDLMSQHNDERPWSSRTCRWAGVGPIPDLRRKFNGVMWHFHVGGPWRNLPTENGLIVGLFREKFGQ